MQEAQSEGMLPFKKEVIVAWIRVMAVETERSR